MGQQWAGLGSPNWDLRSLRLNFEFLLECYDAPFVAQLDGLIDEKISNSTRLTFDHLYERPFPTKLLDAVARLFLPSVTAGKDFKQDRPTTSAFKPRRFNP